MTAIDVPKFRYNPMFGEIPVEETPGRVVWRYQVKKEHFNPAGALHGGVLSTLLDTAMGHAVRTLRPPEEVHAAIQLNITFLAATLKEGGAVTVEGRCLKIGKRVAFAEGVASDESGRELARGTSSYAILLVGKPG